MAHRRKRRRGGRYRRGRLTVVVRVLSFLLICVAIMAALILFFKVETITVSGAARYTDNEIVTENGVYSPLAEDVELSATADCAGTLLADWRNSQELTQLDRVEAQVTYTAMMTDTLLEG